jgi:hypothetical protein
MTVDAFVSQLRAAYGDTLRAVVLYGSAVAGEQFKKQSDVNVLVIVDALPLDRIGAASAAMRAWTDAGNPAPLTFTLNEWRTSSDAFPMEYADILGRHQLLFGDESVLAGVSVAQGDLRVQVEREALSKVFRLRQGALIAGTDEKRQLELMSASLSAIMVVFRGVLRLHAVTPSKNYEELVRDVAARTGIDATPYVDVIRHARGEQPIPKSSAATVLAGYLQGMERVAAHVDRLLHSED